MKKLRRTGKPYKKNPKVKVIGIRVSYDDLELIDANAQKAGMDRSTYMRLCATQKEIKEKPDIKFYETLKDVRKLEIELRQINENKISNSELKAKELAEQISKMIFECYKNFEWGGYAVWQQQDFGVYVQD